MPIIKNTTVIALTRLFKIINLKIQFKQNIVRDYEVISGTGDGAVMIIPFLDNNIIFIKEYAAAINSYSLTFPKGKIDKGEKVLEAANRELQEEIGFKSKNLDLIHVLDLAPGYIDHKTHIVTARQLIASKLVGDEPEELEIIKCPLSSINDFLANTENIDSRVYSALYVYFNITKR